MKVSRILHAGYVFESGSTRILFDPIFENPFSRNCYAYPAVKFDVHAIHDLKVDAVFISHYHDDHCSFKSLQYLHRETPVYLYCVHEELFDLIRKLGFENVYPLKTDVPVKIGSFEIMPRLALDPDVDSIFQISAEGLNILNVVDAWLDPSALEKLKAFTWDMVLWPFQTMRETEVIAPELAHPPELPGEWLEQLSVLRPRYVVPSSCQFIHEEWSWYRSAYFPISYQHFRSEVERVLPASVILRLDPGAAVELKSSDCKTAQRLSWVLPMGPQDVDYEYRSDVLPQPTAEIAKHFRPASVAEAKRVVNFCENELLKKFKEISAEGSFRWKLSLYGHDGQEISYCYEITSQRQIRLIENADDISWVTEVPLIKVFNALEAGESLSSMYLRMKGMPFDDIFEDPLIAAVFSGDYFSYQRHQLKIIT